MKFFLLAVAVCAVLIPFFAAAPAAEAAAAAPEAIRLLVATDLHYIAPELTDGGVAFQTLVDSADGKTTAYCEALTEAFIQTVLEEAPDGVLLTGDLSFNGERISHEALAEKLARLEAAGIPVYVLPGNHDLNNASARRFVKETAYLTESVSGAEFGEIYSAFGYEDALARDEHSLSYMAELAPGLRLLMVDANTEVYPGGVREETLRWVEEQLRTAQEEGVTVLAASHQNLLAHSSLLSQGFVMENARALLALYETYGVPVNFSGHIHMQHTGQSEAGLREIATASMAVTPGCYAAVTLTDGVLSYESIPVDVEAWAEVSGVEDPNLLRFSVWAEEYFLLTARNQALQELGEDTPDAEAMADFFAAANLAYFTGRGNTFVWEGPLYERWQERQSFLSLYIQSMTADEGTDHTALTMSF